MTEQTQIQPQIIVRTQYVKDLSFENPNAPKVLAELGGDNQPEIQLNINVTANPQAEERVFEIVLAITANAKRNDDTVFIAELAYAAVIAIDKSIEDKFLHPMVMIEGPRIVFPFARQMLSNITQAGGFMPLNIQPIDFVRIYQAGVENQTRNAEKQVSGAKANGADDTADAVAEAEGNPPEGKNKTKKD